MADRPYTVLSCGVSLDGRLDDTSPSRLVLSHDVDLDRVDAERASSDAILVGAGTVRSDNPRLLVRSPERRAVRVAAGRPPSPIKVTLTAGGRLDPTADFFAPDGADKVVYCETARLAGTEALLGAVATVRDGGCPLSMEAVAIDLHARGVERLMVEGGGRVLTEFLAGGLADELQLVLAPFFVGQAEAPRFVGDADFPWTPTNPARLLEVRPMGDLVLLRYGLSDRCE